MLVFIIALQSPAVSKNWARVSRMCERTLRSICGQTSPDFRVFLVCNSRPRTGFTHPALTIIERDFPIPATNTASRMNDKWSKLKVGLVAARQFAPAQVMLLDADDCVHCGLAMHVAQYPEANGWLMDTGYLHDEGSRWLYRKRNFATYCGSSAIIRLAPSDFPKSESEPSEGYFILTNGHSVIANYMSARGTPLQTLPFVGSVYMTDTGENDSGMKVGGWQGGRHMIEKLRSARLLTSRVRSVFGLYELSERDE
jgi:hypothetical protein